MELVLDRLIEEMEIIAGTSSAYGGISDVVSVNTIVLDDPGIVIVDDYPYMFVAPVSDEEFNETMGRPGWDRRRLTISIALVINVSDYFDPTVSEVAGTRELVQVGGAIRRHLRRLHKRGLDPAVNNLRVASINYVPDIRGEAFVRMVVVTLIVDKQYPHEI